MFGVFVQFGGFCYLEADTFKFKIKLEKSQAEASIKSRIVHLIFFQRQAELELITKLDCMFKLGFFYLMMWNLTKGRAFWTHP